MPDLCQRYVWISIHALLAESDLWLELVRRLHRISIHALLAESDAAMGNPTFEIAYFYPRSPCGERHLRVVDGSKSSIISIHALLAESDYDTSSLMKCQVKFLSTLSLRRATR